MIFSCEDSICLWGAYWGQYKRACSTVSGVVGQCGQAGFWVLFICEIW